MPSVHSAGDPRSLASLTLSDPGGWKPGSAPSANAFASLFEGFSSEASGAAALNAGAPTAPAAIVEPGAILTLSLADFSRPVETLSGSVEAASPGMSCPPDQNDRSLELEENEQTTGLGLRLSATPVLPATVSSQQAASLSSWGEITSSRSAADASAPGAHDGAGPLAQMTSASSVVQTKIGDSVENRPAIVEDTFITQDAEAPTEDLARAARNLRNSDVQPSPSPAVASRTGSVLDEPAPPGALRSVRMPAARPNVTSNSAFASENTEAAQRQTSAGAYPLDGTASSTAQSASGQGLRTLLAQFQSASSLEGRADAPSAETSRAPSSATARTADSSQPPPETHATPQFERDRNLRTPLDSTGPEASLPRGPERNLSASQTSLDDVDVAPARTSGGPQLSSGDPGRAAQQRSADSGHPRPGFSAPAVTPEPQALHQSGTAALPQSDVVRPSELVMEGARLSKATPPAIVTPVIQHVEMTVPSVERTSAAIAPPPAEMPAELPQQIVQTIRLQWSDGVGHARVHLKPEYLGDLSVTIQVERGNVNVQLEASAPAVREWIAGHESALRQALLDQGLQLDRLVVTAEPSRDRSPESSDRRRSSHPDDSREQPRRERPPDADATFEVFA